VDARILPGEKPNEVIVRLKVSDKPRVSGKVELDNYGERSTGSARILSTVNVNGALGLGEHLQLTGEKTDGTSFGRVAMIAPVGVDGLHLGINAATLSLRTTQPRFTDLAEKGNAKSYGAVALYPLIRTHSANLQGIAQYNYNYFFSSKVDGTGFKTYTSVLQLGLAGDKHDGLGGGGTTAGSMVLFSGNVDLSKSLSQVTDSNGPRTAGSFSKVRFSVHRLQSITKDLSLFVSDSGQVASKNMDESETLITGGPNGVRAYVVGLGEGSQGNMTNFELREKVSEHTSIVGFYDVAKVQTLKNANFAGAPATNVYTIQGDGVGVNWEGMSHLEIKATVAHRLGTPPASVATTFSNNGGISKNRAWLTAALPF
jgi:hemolysin activation/secretion protein